MTPAPILELFERYAGRFIDIERGVTVDADLMRRWRDRIKANVLTAGMSAGDRVVFCIGNGPLFPACLTAVLATDASPILVHADTTGPEQLRLAAAWGARWLLTDGSPPPDAATVWTCGDLAAGLNLHLVPMAGPHDASSAGVPLHPTSGTTGTPKLALRPGAPAVAEALHYAATMDITGADRILCVTPMSHAYAYGMAVMVPLLTGADVIAMRAFNPRFVVRSLVRDNLTILPVVPAMLPILLRSGWNGAPALRLLVAAGAPLSGEVTRSFASATTITPRPLFGTTETGGISVATGEVTPGCVGLPMQGVEMKLDLSGAMPDGTGMLQIRSSSMMAGYLTTEGIAPAVDSGGWFTTGDLARVTTDGQIQLLGRVGDVINVMGHKVLPSEVEAVIATLPGVAEVKVYAGLHPGGSEIVIAAVVPLGSLTAAAVRRHCEAQLVPFKRPTQVHVMTELPRNASGKITVKDLPNAKGPERAAGTSC